MITDLVPNKLDTLAGIINTAQRNIEFHAKSMLFEAKDAGEALLEVKAQLKHGEFKPWVEQNCNVSYRTARQYMQVAKQFDNGTALPLSDLSELSIRAFLDIKDKPKTEKPGVVAPVPSSPSSSETKRVLKVAALATRGEGGEKQAANHALSKYTDAELRQIILDNFEEGLKQQSRDRLLIILTDMAEELS